jgi:restriction system protein
MALPTYQDVMLPLLQAASEHEIRVTDLVEPLAQVFQLSDTERTELLPSGRQTVFANRVGWARTYLGRAGLLEAPRRGFVRLTDEGRRLLATQPLRVDNEMLMQFDSFRAFRGRGHEETGETQPESSVFTRTSLTPDEILRATHKDLEATLAAELLQRARSGTPPFFERLIVNLLIAMGYGGSLSEVGKALVGGSGDNGIDGVIDQDPLGLDRIYVQAKRYGEDNPVGAGAIRDFFGSLDRVKASKGLFVTTSRFSASARDTAEHLSKRLVLIDGDTLARLMIQHNVGCRIQETFYSKAVDEDFFE